MAGWNRWVARTVSEGVASGRRLVGHRPGLRILLYHAVGSRLAHDPYGISLRVEQFTQQVALLSAYALVSLAETVPPPASPGALRVAVTFDDGYKDTLHTAAPLLVKAGIPLTVFVTSSFIQRRSAEYLDPEELKTLAALPGVTIGSHGATHAPLAECGEPTVRRELEESRAYLEDLLRRPVTAMAYPHGSVNRRVREAAHRAGYRLGVCSRGDINQVDRDPLLLCRTEVVAADSRHVFLQKLHGAWDWTRWRRRDPALVA